MKTRGILDNRLAGDILSADDLEDTLQNILDTIVYMRTCKAELLSDKNELYNQIISDISFADWIFDTRLETEYREQKLELMQLVEMCAPIQRAEYEAILLEIETQACQEKLSISVHTDDSNVLYVSTVDELINAKRWFLANYVSRSNFSSEVLDCFPRLFFHKRVKSSINTLCADFAQERPLIVKHLAALDKFADEFQRLRGTGTGSRDMARAFEDFCERRIECSPENDRETARKLDFSFMTKDGLEKTLRCELHTKLKWDNMDRVHQDRIYFHPGDPLIEGGKVLIAHIGEHL